jgi:hypothetical protein
MKQSQVDSVVFFYFSSILNHLSLYWQPGGEEIEEVKFIRAKSKEQRAKSSIIVLHHHKHQSETCVVADGGGNRRGRLAHNCSPLLAL